MSSCGHLGDKVVDSRESREGDVIRRRRQCLVCAKRFTSRERIEEIEYRVVKKDGNREPFQRQKLIAGLLRACEKRPVSVQELEAIADRIETDLQDRPDRELTTGEIGARLMQELKQLDQVAYVRFASVYRQFRDVGQFKREVDELQKVDQRQSQSGVLKRYLTIVFVVAAVAIGRQSVQITPLPKDGRILVTLRMSDVSNTSSQT